MLYLFIFCLTIFFSFFSTLFFRALARKLKIFDYPTSLKSHQKPIPYLGGLAIYSSYLLSTLIVLFFFSPSPETQKLLWGVLLGGSIVTGLGLVDDLKDLSPAVKIFGQTVAAIALIFFEVKIKFIANPFLSLALTLFWLVGITNAFNIIDIMDGLAAGIAFIASLSFFLIAFSIEKTEVVFLTVILAGSILGFLKFNFKPASIFMGDSGSLFLGFVLGGIAIGESYTTINDLALYVPLLILGIPIYDTFLVMILRKIKGKPILKGSGDHLAFRLKALGLTELATVGILYLVSIILSVSGYFITIVKTTSALIIYLSLGVILAIFSWQIGRVKID